MSINLRNRKILVTGGSGFLGQHVLKRLVDRGLSKNRIFTPGSNEIDLRKIEDCISAVRNVDVVIHLAAKIGGIGFNKEKPAEIFYDNALMGLQLMEAARLEGVEKMVTVGTVCAYPKDAPIPFKESSLWEGYPEEITAPYGIAKKMMIVQGKAYNEQYGFKHVMLLPVNLYGPGDHFESNYSHVMAALIKRIVDAKKLNAKSITVWGTGKARREFLYVEDAVEGIILAAERYEKLEPVNLGSGLEVSIADLVELIKKAVNYTGETVWDSTKPDGVLRRNMDISKAYKEFDFKAKTNLKDGIRKTVEWYIKNKK